MSGEVYDDCSMALTGPAAQVLRNLLKYGDLSFRDFVEIALYHPEMGYYSGASSPVGKEGDYVTSPSLSPLFSYAIGRLIDEFVTRSQGAVCSFVDMGCGDGTLLRSLNHKDMGLWGVDRSLERVSPDAEAPRFVKSLLDVPREGHHILFSNELFDALPFSRLVMRRDGLHELWVHETEDGLDWSEHEAPELYDDYFASHDVTLDEGQFADVSLDWAAFYRELASFSEHCLIVTFDYGYRAKQLFHPRARRFGTAAAYSQQRVSRDLLANAGGQDLTAHINFDDLIREGEGLGYETLYFDRQAKFLLSLGLEEHPLLAPMTEAPENVEKALELREKREEARRLIMPDGIGEEIRVLVQGRGVANHTWSFQRKLF